MNLKRRLGAGRPRELNSDRYPSGQIRRDPRLNNLWQRIRGVAVKIGADPRMESEVGRLTLFGHLTGSDFEAADRFATTVARWETVMGMPRRTSASPSYLIGRGGIDNSEPDQETIDDARDAYARMMAVIPLHPIHIRNMLESVVIDNEMCSESGYADLHRLLERLADLWGIK